MLKHSVFHAGRVQSIGFELHGRRTQAGAMAVGEYTFAIREAERLTVLRGEMLVRLAGQDEFTRYPAGTSFEAPAESNLELRVEIPCAYVCEFFCLA